MFIRVPKKEIPILSSLMADEKLLWKSVPDRPSFILTFYLTIFCEINYIFLNRLYPQQSYRLFIFLNITDCYNEYLIYLIKIIRFCTIIAWSIFYKWEVIELIKLQGDQFINREFLGGMNHRYNIIDYCWNSGHILFIWNHHVPDFDIKWNPDARCWENRGYEISAENIWKWLIKIQ